MKFAALGRTQLLYDSIVACLERGHELVLVGTCQSKPEYGRSEKDFKRLAQESNSPFFCDAKINQSKFLKLMKEAGAQVAISVNWLTLIGQEVRDQFENGVINGHFGDLPRYRGNACPNWAIFAGEDKIVITLHKMATELDAGPILFQKSFPLTPNTYIGDFYAFAEKTMPSMFVHVLDGLEAGTIEPREQSKDLKHSLRCFPRLPQDGYIDWNHSAENLARLVRASSKPFTGAFTFMGDEKLIVWRAYASELPYPYLGVPGQVAEVRKSSGEVVVLSGEGALVLEEVETLSYGRKSAAEILTSTRMRLGIDPTHIMETLKD